MKEIRIKNNFRDWFDGEILDKIILRDKCLKKLKASRLNIDEQLYKEAKVNVQKNIKTQKETSTKKNFYQGKMLASPRSYGKPLNP